jgi:hypothetical protein
VDWLVKANVSERRAVCTLWDEVESFGPEDGDMKLLRSVGFYQPIHTAI